MKGMGHKKGKGGVPKPSIKKDMPSQGQKFDPKGAASNGTADAAYDGTNGSD